MNRAPQSRGRFRLELLRIMDQKHHWAWPVFAGQNISKAQLKIHFQQECAVYVRDFPVFLARIHGKNPPPAVRRMLAENIFEEDTGGLSLGMSHPELFLKMMKGLGYRIKDFERIALLPESRRYRGWLDCVSDHTDWVVGAAVFTIFVEGSVKDRKEILGHVRPKTRKEIEEHVRHHPLVRHHGLSPKQMDLIRAHQLVESGHRQDAYEMVVNYAKDRGQQQAVLAAMTKSLQLWLRYRDGVARACGIRRENVT